MSARKLTILEMTVGLKRIVNLGNYENIHLENSVTVAVKIGEEETAYLEAMEFCKKNILAEVKDIKNKLKQKL